MSLTTSYPFTTESNYIYDSAKIEFSGGKARLKLGGATPSATYTDDFSSSSGKTFNASEIEITGGVAKLKDQATTASFSDDFSTPANWTVSDANKIEVTGGVGTLKIGGGSGQADTYIDDMDSGADKTYNASNVDFSGGVCKLKDLGGSSSWTSNFNNSSDYTYDSNDINFTGSVAELKETSFWSKVTWYWRFEEASWNGTSGEVIDEKGANNGTAYGGVTTNANGKLGRGATFDGTDDYIQLNEFETTDIISISVWVKPASIGSDMYIYDDSGSSSTGGGVSIRIKSDGKVRFWVTDASTAVVDSLTTLTAGNWYHLVGTYDGVNVKLFINGSLDNSASASLVSRNDVAPRIGHSEILGGYFNGDIDEVIVSDQEFTATDVSDLYNSGNGSVNKYPADNPYIDINDAVGDGEDVTSWDSFTEIVTESGSDEIRYLLSDDNGATWKYWNGSSWVTSDGSFTQSNDGATVNSNISSFPVTSNGIKIRVLLHSDIGYTTPNIDNIDIGYTITSYTTTPQAITYNNDNISPSQGIYSLDSFTETATKPSNTEIRYILSNDSGTTWQYWNGSSWATSDGTYNQANTASEINTNISSFATPNDTLMVRFFLDTDDSKATPELDKIEIGYKYNNYATDNPYLIKSTQWSETNNISSWDSFIETVTESGSDEVRYVLSNDNGTTWLYWNGSSWATSDGTYAQSSSGSDISTNISSFPATNPTMQVKIFLHSNDGSTTPTISNIQFDYTKIEYLTTNPTISYNSDNIDKSAVGIYSWNSFTETSTKTGSDEIKYILSTDSGATWQYWNGSSWATSDGTYSQANTALEINSNISSLDTSSGTLRIKIFLHSEDDTSTPELDNLEIGYKYNAYATDNPTIICSSGVYADSLQTFSDTITASGSDAIKYTLLVDGTEKYWNGSAWVDANGTYAQTNTSAEINTNASSLLSSRVVLKWKAYLHSNDGTTTPEIDNINITYDYGAPTPDSLEKCYVYGFLRDVEGNAKSSHIVKITPIMEAMTTSGVQLEKEAISTTTDSDGYWEALLIRSSEWDATTGDVYYKVEFYESDGTTKAAPTGIIVVPDSATAAYSTITQ